MKTLLLYVIGIPCIFVGSRIAGLDAAFTSSRTPAGPIPVNNSPRAAGPSPQAEKNVISAVAAVPLSEEATAKQLVAVVVPRQSVCIEATATGILRRILVHSNQSVEEGQRLALVDTREVEAEIHQQQLLIRVWQSKVREAAGEFQKIQAKLNRRQPLLAKGIVSAEEIDELRMESLVAAERIEQGEAEVVRSEAEAKRLEASLDRYVLTAPFRGVVKRVEQRERQFVHEGDVILEIESMAKQVRTLVPRELSTQIRRLRFHVDAAPGGRQEVTVAEIAPQDAVNGHQIVLFDLPDAECFISHQPLTVHVESEPESTERPQESDSALAAR